MGLAQYQYNEGDSEWFSTFLARVEKQSKGFIGISLTNYNTSTVCAIAAGSVVEINGALFICSTETSISGSISTGLNYIILSVTGTTASPYFSQAAGTWDEDKQGWYTGNNKYIADFNSNGTTYDEKYVYSHARDMKRIESIKDQGAIALTGLRVKIIEIGTWDMDANNYKTVAHGLGADYKKIRNMNLIIRNDIDSIYYTSDKWHATDLKSEIQIDRIEATVVYLVRRATGFFDSTAFDTMGDDGNRGWLIIWYES